MDTKVTNTDLVFFASSIFIETLGISLIQALYLHEQQIRTSRYSQRGQVDVLF
jgi:hypothetical protein